MSATNYGVSVNRNVADPTMTRIGNMSLHQASELPVHNKIRKCLLLDNGTVNYYLDRNSDLLQEDGVTPSVLDGTDGQVMVEIPEHYVRFDTSGDLYMVQVSEKPLYGYHKQRTIYVGAYEGSLERSGNKLSSVINNTAAYRGGANQSAWDAEPRSQLGKPATAISLTNFRTYAKNRGGLFSSFNAEAAFVIYYLYLIEYANRNCQAEYNPTLTAEGYRQGGLGPGVTNVTSADWSAFSSYYPIVPCGVTASLGVNSGVVSYSVEQWKDGNPLAVSVPSYRGIENPYGHLWKWLDGILVNVQSDAEGGQSIIYGCQNDEFASTITNDYREIGLLTRDSNYIRDMIWGRKFGFLPSSASGAGATTYWCDRIYNSIPATGSSLRGLFVGGAASASSNAGFACVSAHNAPSSTAALIGSRLCMV